MNEFNTGSWTFERPFRFESNGALEDVVRSLAALEEDGGFFSSSRREISILPLRDGYTFRYRIRRRNKSSSYTTAFAEGQVWEDEGGVVVEGSAQIDPWSLYGSIGLFVIMSIIFGLVSRGLMGWLPLLFMGIGAFMIFTYYRDRNQVFEQIQQAVEHTFTIADQFRTPKEKNDIRAEKIKNTRLNAPGHTRPDSVWNEAISEYEDDETSRDGR